MKENTVQKHIARGRYMITVPTSQLKPGMITAAPAITKHGQEIVTAATSLTSQLISRLTFYKITSVMITEASYDSCCRPADSPKEHDIPATEEEPMAEPQAPSAARSYSQTLKSSPTFQAFQTDYSQNIVRLMNSFQELISGNISASLCDDLLRESSKMFSSKTSLEIFDMIHGIRSVDDTVYAHSLNVALISRAIGKWLHFSRNDLDTLTLAGLLHDIGKTQVPDEILNKQGKLTEEEFHIIRNHTLLGYKLLEPTALDVRIKLAALQHHERYDGSGYPQGLPGDEIDDFASIVAIADVYDAMTAARAYRAPLCAFQVISAFEEEGFQKYNPQIIVTFLRRVANCYNNSRILLSNGVSGYVIFINDKKLSRPMIKIDNDELIDLCAPEHHELYIKAII